MKRHRESQISLLLIAEAHLEALVVEVHHVEQRRRRAVVEIRPATGESAQYRALEAAHPSTSP